MSDGDRATRCSVAVVVRRGSDGFYLAVRRPWDDEQLPGLWGLPAATLGGGELPEQAVRRIGVEKLGVRIEPSRFLGIKSADRGSYELILMDIEATLVEGNPDVHSAVTTRTRYIDQQWTDRLELLQEAADRGSLCCRIFLEAEGREVVIPAKAAIQNAGPVRRNLDSGFRRNDDTPSTSMIVTLLTDFGTADYFVPAMKGVILSKAPAVSVVDISHEIAPHDIRAAAFLLLGAYRAFPEGSIHVAVVDPGVGSDRSPIVLAAGGHFFVGPNNGVFDMVLEREEGAIARRIGTPALIAPDSSNTFHGRDIFAPAAAALATGMPFGDVGEIVEQPVRLRWLVNHPVDSGRLEGSILHVDRFGNCVTSFEPGEFNPRSGFCLRVKGQRVDDVRPFYASTEGLGPFVILGSAGFYEIAVNQGSAAKLLGIRAGDKVVAEPREGQMPVES